MSTICPGCSTPYASDTDRFCARCGRARSDANAPAPSAAKGAASTAAAIGLAAVFVVIPIVMVLSSAMSSVEGSVAVHGPGTNFTFTPTGCASMQPFGRMGANLHGDGPNDGGVYVTLDPLSGQAVTVEIPGSCKNADGTDCALIALARDRCPTWDVGVEHNGTTFNDVRLVRGHARIACTLEDGTRVEGAFTFNGC